MTCISASNIPRKRRAMEIDVAGDGLLTEEAEQLVKTVLTQERQELARVSVSFVAPAQIAKLNSRYRGKAGPTDVLSFPFDASFPHGSGGEVVVAPEVVRDLAAREEREYEAALRETVVHGVLHLLGYQDETDEQAARMAVRTKAILEIA